MFADADGGGHDIF